MKSYRPLSAFDNSKQANNTNLYGYNSEKKIEKKQKNNLKQESSIFFDYGSFIKKATKYSWILIIFAVIGFFYSKLKLSKMPDLYRAKATMRVLLKERDPSEKINSNYKEDITSLASITTTVHSMNEDFMRLNVARALDMKNDPIYFINGRPPTDNQMIYYLADKVRINLRRGTTLIDIHVSDENPNLAAHIANAYVYTFLHYRETYQKQHTEKAYAQFVERLSSLAEQVEAIEIKVDDFKRNNKNINFQDVEMELSGGGISNTFGGGTVTRSPESMVKENRIISIYQQIDDANSRLLSLKENLESINLGIMPINYEGEVNNIIPDLDNLDQNISLAEKNKAIIESKYGWNNTKWIKKRNILGYYKRQKDKILNEKKEHIKIAIRKNRNLIIYLKGELEQLKKPEVKNIDENVVYEKKEEKIREYKRIKKDLASKQFLYEQLLNASNELEISAKITNQEISFDAMALAPTYPYSPKREFIMLSSVVVSSSLGLFLVGIISFFTHRIESHSNIEIFFGIPCIACVPKTNKFLNIFKNKNSYLKNYNTPAGESFRSISTTLPMMSDHSKNLSFLITSSDPGEGKSFISVNSAVAIAKSGKRTLLIDGDLRKKSLHSYFKKTDNNALGLIDYVSGKCKAEEICFETEINNLSLIPVGGQGGFDAGSVLSSHKFRKLVKNAFKWFDVVIIDSSPLGPVSDSLLIGNVVNSIVLVVKYGKSKEKHLTNAIKQIRHNHSEKISGFVMNGAKLSASHKSSAYLKYYSGASKKKKIA